MVGGYIQVHATLTLHIAKACESTEWSKGLLTLILVCAQFVLREKKKKNCVYEGYASFNNTNPNNSIYGKRCSSRITTCTLPNNIPLDAQYKNLSSEKNRFV